MILFTLIFIVIFWFLGLILMIFPGFLAKFVAIPAFLYTLPIIAGKWVIYAETPFQIFNISIPALYQGELFMFNVMLLYVASVNFLETDIMGNRDYLGRKPKTAPSL